jgi:hypothetical protein
MHSPSMTTPICLGLLGLYWGPRGDAFDACVQRAHASLALFHSAGFASYFQLGRSRSAAMKKPVAIEPESIRALLQKGSIYSDIPREPISELGWGLSLWSGGPDAESYSISLRCGAVARELRFPNCLVFNFPRTGRSSLAEAKDRACLLFDQLVELWSPESGLLQEQAAAATPGGDRPPLRELRQANA